MRPTTNHRCKRSPHSPNHTQIVASEYNDRNSHVTVVLLLSLLLNHRKRDSLYKTPVIRETAPGRHHSSLLSSWWSSWWWSSSSSFARTPVYKVKVEKFNIHSPKANNTPITARSTSSAAARRAGPSQSVRPIGNEQQCPIWHSGRRIGQNSIISEVDDRWSVSTSKVH